MYDAGSAWFTLGARVLRDGFDSYGRLVSTAKQEREHEVRLGARTSPAGFNEFNAQIARLQKNMSEFVYKAKGSWDEVSNATTRMAAASDRDLGSMRRVLGLTAEGYNRTAVEARTSADSIVRSNERIAASAGGGGAGRGGGVAAAAAAGGAASEQQAKRTTAAWKDGFNTLAGLGKWVTLGILGVGGVSLKVAADFQKQMELLRTQAGYTQHDVEQLRKSVLALAPAVGIGPTKLAEGLFHIASSGIPAAKSIEILKISAEGAKVGNADLEHVTNALVAVLRTAPKDIHSTAEAMGVLNDIVGHGNLRMEELTASIGTGLLAAAKAVGLGLRDVGSALDTMTSRGIPAQEGATRLRTVLGLIADPTTKAQKALDQLGFQGDRLAKDFREKGLIGALMDLQGAMQNVFGKPLTKPEELKALTDYATRLKESGASASTARKDLEQFKVELEKQGEGAIKSSQLIAEAFGGARMGTTMQILIQNVDDVRKHFNELNRAGAAQRFQAAWDATRKDFSQKASELGANVQRLAITLGLYLIPKVEDLVKWLIEAGKWMGRHKELADALAIAFGTLLVAAVTTFFARLIGKTAEGIASIGRFGKSIYDLPKTLQTATEKMVANMREQQVEADRTAAAYDRVGQAAADSAAGGVAGGGSLGAVGPLEGLITGVRGSIAPGSLENPMAMVLVEALGGTGGALAGAGAKASAAERTAATEAEQVAVARGLTVPGRAAAGESLAIATGALGKGASSLLRGAGVAGIGLVGAQLAGSLIPGSVGHTVGQIGTGAAIGAGVGSIVPGIGTALGAGLGAAAAIALKIFGDKSYGKQVADTLTSGFGGEAANNLKNDVAKHLDAAKKALEPVIKTNKESLTQLAKGASDITLTGPSARAKAKAQQEYKTAGLEIAQQLERGWNQYKFQSEPVMFNQLRAEVKSLPPEARAWAIESAVNFAHGLESQGRLTKGSANKLLQDAKSSFPQFENYLHLQGVDSAKTFAAAFNLTEAEKNTKRTLNRIANDFPTVEQAMANSTGGVQEQAKNMVAALKDVIAHGTGPMKKQAETDLKELRDKMKGYFQSMASEAELRAGELKKAISQGSAQAAVSAGQNFQAFVSAVKSAMQAGVITTRTGLDMINKATIQELQQLGVSAKDAKKLASQGWSVGTIAHSLSSAASVGIGTVKTSTGQTITIAAGGGMLPGGEYGYGDVMTLVDPMGNPRAKMAGDEAVFNRHQMPYVEAGLQMLGFHGAEDLWRTVNRPHGYQQGGQLPHFARGGGVSGGGSTNTGTYVYPIPGFALGRTDQGIDASAPVGTPILAIGDSRLTNVIQSWFAGQPLMALQLTSGPDAGRYWYVAEQISPVTERIGSVFKAGQAVAHFAPSGTAIEMGWAANAGGETLARATTGYTEGQVTPAGSDFRNFILGLAHGKLVGGGPAGGIAAPSWKNIKEPKVQGTGIVAAAAQRALDIATKAANDFGTKHASSASVGGGGKGFPALPGGWFRVGATIDPTMGQAPTYDAHGGFSFAELLEAGRNAGMRPDLTQLLGLPRAATGFGAPMETPIQVRMPGSHTAYQIWKNDVGSGQPGDPHYLVDLHQAIANALHWTPNQDIEVKKAAQGGRLFPTPPRRRVRHRRPRLRHTQRAQGVDYSKMPQGQKNQIFMNKYGQLWSRLLAMGVVAPGSSRPTMNIVPTDSPQVYYGEAAGGTGQVWYSTQFVNQLLNPSDDNHYYALDEQIHEMAHALQIVDVLGGPTWMREGGAQAWSDEIASRLYGGTFGGPDDDHSYYPYVQQVKSQLGMDWVNHGQFGFAGGGMLPGYASGGRHHPAPKKTHSKTFTLPKVRGVPGYTTTVPGSASKKTKSGPKRKKQPLSQTTADVLAKVGLGSFVSDQNLLGQLDNQYSMQEQLFNTFDSGQAGLPLEDLDVLMGIREQEWHILSTEFRQLPKAIDRLQKIVNRVQGHPASPASTTGQGAMWGTMPAHHIAAAKATGVTALTGEVSAVEAEIASLERDVTKDVRAAATARHKITAAALNLADQYASQTGTILSDMTAITDERHRLTTQANALRRQKHALAKSKKPSTSGSDWSPGGLAGQVFSGTPSGSSRRGSTGESPQARALQKKIDAISARTDKLRGDTNKLRHILSGITRKRQADARRLHRQGFDEAWTLMQDKWKLQDKIAKLKDKLTKLKAALKEQTAILNTDTAALTQLNSWLTGGLQGDQSIKQSLGDVGMEILDLYQQGADLPTPGDMPIPHKQKPTLGGIENFLTKVLGLTLPSIVGGGAGLTGAAAYQDFLNFQASRQQLFQQFGSNFVPSGAAPFGSSAALGAGVQYYGAAAGAGSGTPAGGPGFAQGGYLPGGRGSAGPGSTTINIEQHFGAGPPDPHTYSAGLTHELGAMV